MNGLSEIATPLVEMPWFLGLIALVACAFSVHWFTTVSAGYWGSNRILYLVSLGNQKIGRLIAPIPGVMSLGVAVYFGCRAIGVL